MTDKGEIISNEDKKKSKTEHRIRNGGGGWYEV